MNAKTVGTCVATAGLVVLAAHVGYVAAFGALAIVMGWEIYKS